MAEVWTPDDPFDLDDLTEDPEIPDVTELLVLIDDVMSKDGAEPLRLVPEA